MQRKERKERTRAGLGANRLLPLQVAQSDPDFIGTARMPIPVRPPDTRGLLAMPAGFREQTTGDQRRMGGRALENQAGTQRPARGYGGLAKTLTRSISSLNDNLHAEL